MNKLKISYILLILFFFSLLNYSQENKSPKIFCKEPTLNFGTVSKKKAKLKHTFIIKNIGDDVLRIKNSSVSCGCTVLEIKDKDILPGKATRINVQLNLRGLRGENKKEIILETNDPSNKYFRLYLKGNVKVK